MAPRPCERCGAAASDSQLFEGINESFMQGAIEDDSPQNEAYDAMCMEVQIAYGLVAWLCHDCRKEYHRYAKDLQLNIDYAELSLRFEFWKARVGVGTPPDEIEKGLELWRQMESIEKLINDDANRWLLSSTDYRRDG